MLLLSCFALLMQCNHDFTHRVCARLVDTNNAQCKPLLWGNKDFWDLTGQKQFEWSSTVCSAPNPGDSWCICMWAFARTIEQVGCENVHIHCDSTDVHHLLQHYHDGRQRLDTAHDCIQAKCAPQGDETGAKVVDDSERMENSSDL